jgi:hypothetical protein
LASEGARELLRRDFEAPLFGSELGEIQYAISRKEWLAVSAVIPRP